MGQGPRHSNILDNLTLSFHCEKWKKFTSHQTLQIRFWPLEKRTINRITLYPHIRLWINSYEKNHNERKKTRNELFTFQHLRYITSCIGAQHARHVSVFISFTTRWLPGRPKLRYLSSPFWYTTRWAHAYLSILNFHQTLPQIISTLNSMLQKCFRINLNHSKHYIYIYIYI